MRPSALPESLKSHVLNKMRLGDAYIKSVCDYKVSDLNLITMLYSLASSNPVRKVCLLLREFCVCLVIFTEEPFFV